MNITEVKFVCSCKPVKLCDDCIADIPRFFNRCEYTVDAESREDIIGYKCPNCGKDWDD